MRLEGLLGDDGLDQRAARVASTVASRLERPEVRRPTFLSVLGHPALAAAAAAASLIVGVASGRSDPWEPHPTLGQVLGTSGIEQLEAELQTVLPSWIEIDDEDGSR